MKENSHTQDALEQRLRSHYKQQYGQLPEPDAIWARVQPELDQQSASVPLSTPRFSLLHLLRRKISAQQTDESYTSDQSVQQASKPAHAQDRRASKRHLLRAGEMALAAIVVASLLLGWLAVTRWNALGNRPDLYTYASAPGEYIYDLQWMPDGKHLMFATYTQATHTQSTNHYRYLVWDATTGKTRQTLNINLPASLMGKAVVDAPDGRYAVFPEHTDGQDTWSLKLANILTGQSQQMYQAAYQGQDTPEVVFSADSKYLAFVGADARLYLWDIAAGKVRQETSPLAKPGSVGKQWLMWSLDDQRIIAKSEPELNASVQMWSTQTGQKLLDIGETLTLSLFFWNPTSGNLGGLSLNGTRILTYNAQTNSIVERASQSLKILHTLAVPLEMPGQTGIRGQPLWVANDTRILLQEDKEVYLWDSNTGKLLTTISLKNDPQTSGFNIYPSIPGGRSIAFGTAGNLVAIWDLVTGKEAASIRPTIGLQNGVSWSQNGKYLDMEDDTQHGQIYNALTGKLMVNYQGSYALLSLDARYIVTREQNDQQTLVRILPIE